MEGEKPISIKKKGLVSKMMGIGLSLSKVRKRYRELLWQHADGASEVPN